MVEKSLEYFLAYGNFSTFYLLRLLIAIIVVVGKEGEGSVSFIVCVKQHASDFFSKELQSIEETKTISRSMHNTVSVATTDDLGGEGPCERIREEKYLG